MSKDYDKLKPYVMTDRQGEVLDALIAHGGVPKAAVALGLNERTIRRLVKRIEAQAARADATLHQNRTVPDGFALRGVSTLYNRDGDKVMEWVKSHTDQQRQLELMQEAVAAFAEDLPREAPFPPPGGSEADLACQYTITDYHLGMLSWAEETGEDWDSYIAEDLLMAWFARAIQLAPAAHTGILAQMGDFLHFDGLEAVTPEHRNILDSDTRFQRVVRVAIKLFRLVISLMLQKHEHVHVIMADANHDPASSAWLRELLYAFYEDEPRVTVDRNADTYYCFEWGNTALFYHHGHKRKVGSVADVFVAKYREVFGRTKHAYAHLGHRHSRELIETNLMIVEQHRTLAAMDAYASRGGWISGRSAQVITYSKRFGEVGRIVLSPEMVKE